MRSSPYIDLVGVRNFLCHLEGVIEHEQSACESGQVEVVEVFCIVKEVEDHAAQKREAQSEDLLGDLEGVTLSHESLQEFEIDRLLLGHFGLYDGDVLDARFVILGSGSLRERRRVADRWGSRLAFR